LFHIHAAAARPTIAHFLLILMHKTPNVSCDVGDGRGVPVFVASFDDLIKIKRAANRPKDREDLKALLAIKKMSKKK